MLDDELQQVLQGRRDLQRYRGRMVVSSPQSTHIDVDKKQYLAFSSNDYLGLANHPLVIDSFKSAADKSGVGSGASHLVCGHSDYHHQLEEALAEFTGRERVLLFSTGYMANLGVISALIGRSDTVLEDRLNHASLIDAGILSRAQFKRFHHNNLVQLEKQLQAASGRKLVVVDGVFSMDGDLASLSDMAPLCHKYDAHLMIDDAHGFGVLGESGGGCAEYFQLSQQELPVVVGTLGKAFGTFGAFVAGSEVLIETLIQLARSYIYTTALPPAVAAATLASLSLIQGDEGKDKRNRLQQRIKQFREGAINLGLPLMDSSTPIQPVVLGDDASVLTVANNLKESGILIGAIRPPTVPEGTARLRITFSSEHSEEDVERLLLALDQSIPTTIRNK
jgi:8-amino-7-oxononanoate synthase